MRKKLGRAKSACRKQRIGKVRPGEKEKKKTIPVARGRHRLEVVRVAMAILVDVRDEHVRDVDNQLGVVEEVDLDHAVAEAEHNRVLGAQPLFDMHKRRRASRIGSLLCSLPGQRVSKLIMI